MEVYTCMSAGADLHRGGVYLRPSGSTPPSMEVLTSVKVGARMHQSRSGPELKKVLTSMSAGIGLLKTGSVSRKAHSLVAAA